MNTSARSGDLRQFVLALPALVLALSLYSKVFAAFFVDPAIIGLAVVGACLWGD